MFEGLLQCTISHIGSRLGGALKIDNHCDLISVVTMVLITHSTVLFGFADIKPSNVMDEESPCT